MRIHLKDPKIRMIIMFMFVAYVLLFMFYNKSRIERLVPTKNAVFVSPKGGEVEYNKKKYQTHTFEVAVQKVKPSDTVYLFPGVYSGPLKFTGKGSEANPISLRSSEDVLFESSSDCLTFSDSEWVFVEFLEFKNCKNSSIKVQKSKNLYFNDLKFTKTESAFKISKSNSNIVIEKSQAHKIDRFLVVNDKLDGLTLQKNQIENAKDAFIFLDSSKYKNIQLKKNELQNISSSAISLAGEVLNFWIYENKIFEAKNVLNFKNIDGGLIYVFSNLLSNQEDKIKDDVVFIWTSESKISQPFYIFHNTWIFNNNYIQARHSNQFLRHFNNLLISLRNKNPIFLDESTWSESYQLGYDMVNFEVSSFLKEHWKNITIGKPEFTSIQKKDYSQKTKSLGIDAGIPLKILGWTSEYYGSAPAVGAFEGGDFISGPPFRRL